MEFGLEAGRRLSRRPAIIYVALTLLSFPILELILDRQQAVQYVQDVLDGDLPLLAAIAADWQRFGPSLWDAHVTAGNATLAQLAVPPFTPDFLLSFFLPLFSAYAVTYALLIWVAGYGMHRFLRESLRVPVAAAYVGGVAYGFSFWHYVHGFAVPLLPLILWQTDRLVSGGKSARIQLVLLILLQTFALYAGLLQLAVIVGLAQLGYLILSATSRGQALRHAAMWAGMWAVSALLFAPVFLTLLAYLGTSQRAAWQLTDFVNSRPIPAIENWLVLYANVFVGIPLGTTITGTADYAGTYFLGPLLLPLLVVGILTRRSDGGRRFALALLIAIPTLDLISVLATPLQQHLGFLSSFQFVRVRHLLPFALAANAALGTEAALRYGWLAFRRKPVIAALVPIGALVLLQLSISVANVSAAVAGTVPWTRTDAGWLLALLSLGAGLAAAAGLALTRRIHIPVRLGPAVVVILLLVLLVGERAVYARVERDLHGGYGRWVDYMSIDPAKRFIATSVAGSMHRVMTAGADPNTVALAGVDEVGGYQSVYPQRYQNLYGVMTDPYLVTDSGKWFYFHRWGSRAYVFGPGIRFPIADLLGVQWIYARGMQLTDDRLTARFRWGNVTVYENSSAFPRAFVVNQLRNYSSDLSLLDALAGATDDDLRSAAYVVGQGPLLQSPTSDHPASATQIVDYQPDRVEVAVQTSDRGVLVLADTYAPGWTATVGGREATIFPVDEALRGVVVPRGESRVVFAYRPWFTYAGFGLGGLAVLGLLIFVAFALWRDPPWRPRVKVNALGGPAPPEVEAGVNQNIPSQPQREN